MINKRKLLHAIAVIIGVFLLSLTFIITKSQTGLAVSVKPILPKNQHNSEATYYDLRMKPSQKQELKLSITNTSDEEQTVTFQINDATTNNEGDIDYSDRTQTVPKDKSLKISFKDIATIETQRTIPAKKTITTIVHLKMPEKQFDGMILGGIKVVSSATDKKQQSSNKKQPRKKTYIVAVKLTETDAPVVAKLNLLDISSEKIADKNVIKATVQNDQAINLEAIDFTAKIYKKNSNKIFLEAKTANYRMAPNSNFSFIANGEKELPAGEYQIDLTAKSKATNQEWNWKKEIAITKSDKSKVTKSTISSEKDIMFYIVIFTATFVLLLVILLILLISRKRKEKRYEEALRQKRKLQARNKKVSKQQRVSEVNKKPRRKKRRLKESREPKK